MKKCFLNMTSQVLMKTLYLPTSTVVHMWKYTPLMKIQAHMTKLCPAIGKRDHTLIYSLPMMNQDLIMRRFLTTRKMHLT